MLGFLRGPYPGGLPTSWDLGEEFSPSSPSPSRSLLQQHRDYVAMHGGPPTFSSQLAETLSHAETQALTLGMEGLALGTADLTLGVAGLTLGTAGLTLGTADLTLGTAMLLFAAPAKGQRLWQAGGSPGSSRGAMPWAPPPAAACPGTTPAWCEARPPGCRHFPLG